MKKLAKLNKDIFIERSLKNHSIKYDYSNVIYVNNSTKVKIICPEHGEFWQTPMAHLTGQECPICGRKKANKSLMYNTEIFINKAKEKYGDKYDYSNVIYEKSTKKIDIICNKCGKHFFQTPAHHLGGEECPYCYGSPKKNIEDFIKEAVKIHGDKYDYSKFIYKGNKVKSIIICPEHGEFSQTPAAHLKGSGCPMCSESSGERKIRMYLEKHNIKFIQEYKFEKCRNIFPLPFDFYLPDKNLVIEFQGKQHFQPVSFGEKDINIIMKKFSQQQLNDNTKRKFCEENNIKEIEIKYYDNINNIMESIST